MLVGIVQPLPSPLQKCESIKVLKMTKLCKVSILSLSFHYLVTAEICSSLTEGGNKEIMNQVQMEVNNFKLYQQYMDIPQSFISLYLGPISGQSPPLLPDDVFIPFFVSRSRQEASNVVTVHGNISSGKISSQ